MNQNRMKSNNNNNNNYRNNNNTNQGNNSFNKTSSGVAGGGGGNSYNNNYDRRNKNQPKPQQQSTSTGQSNEQQTSQERPSQQHHQHQSQYPHNQNQNQRDRSSQRNQHPDSSMSRADNTDYGNPQNSLGSIRFTPGQSTRELPPIETKADANKKFTGRCRLFIGNLPHNTSEEKLKTLFEQYGEVGEVFLGPKSAFAFIKMDTRQNAEAARDALDCSNYDNRTLRVRLAAHAAAIRIKHLSPAVTNELLAYAFKYFGEIERAVVVVDDKGRSIGEGVVEYSKKQSAQYAIKRCQQECFMLTASPMPVLVEPFDQRDEDEGLPEKSVNKNTIEYKEQRDVGPRFAEQGSFEHSFALKWKELYEIEKQKRERTEQEIQEARKNLQDQIEFSRLEHNINQYKSKLQQLEDNRMKFQQMKDQHGSDVQQREEERRQQDLLIRQREDEILRRQQLGDANNLNQQENDLRLQASALHNLLNNQDSAQTTATITINEDGNNGTPQNGTLGGMTMNQAGMIPFQINTQPRTFANVAMMGQPQQQTQSGFLSQPPMAMQPPISQPNMFTPYLPQQQNPMPMNAGIPQYQMQQQQQQQQQQQPPPQQQSQQQQPTRQSKYNSGNNINLTGPQRPRKRGRF